MKIDDLKKAYDSVSANGELKEKVFSRLDIETEEDIPKMEAEMSHIQLKKGGDSRITAIAFCAAAAMIAMAFVLSSMLFNFDVDIADPPVADVTETTASETAEIPENTALVTLRVVDEDGVPVKNLRIDYLPVIIEKQEDPDMEDGYRTSYTFDMENFDKGGTVPITYGRDMELLIPYGDYCFSLSDGLPNAEYDMVMIERFGRIIYIIGSSGSQSELVTVDENTEEIVMDAYIDSYRSDPRLGVILQDSNGTPLPDYTVILKPTDGVMMEGYSDKYGGYVLTVTDENGEAFWRDTVGSTMPFSGEYEVIAYKEELHTADEPILEPFVFDGDNTFSYVYDYSGIIDEKTFRMAK